MHSTFSIDIPRVVPQGTLTVCGKHFSEGSVLSVPSHSLHRFKGAWGDDVEAYRPERWFEIDQAELQRTFTSFSFGPRACISELVSVMRWRMIG